MIRVKWSKTYDNYTNTGETYFFIDEDINIYVKEMLAYGFGLDIKVIE